jgi:hypothetical protein
MELGSKCLNALLLSIILSRLLTRQAVNVRTPRHSQPKRRIIAYQLYVLRLKEGRTPYREISTINDSTADVTAGVERM